MIKSVNAMQTKIKIVSVGKIGPPGAASFYNLLDYSLNSDGSGIKNIDYGFGASLISEFLEEGKYRISSNVPLFLNSRITVDIINNNNPSVHIISKVTVVSDVVLEVTCIDYESGGYKNCDLAIVIKRLKT